jgi:hypothetical protein
MTFLETVSDLAESGATEGVTLGNNLLAPIVQQGINEGLSGNAMLSAIKGAGLGIRRSSFLDLVGGVRAAALAAPDVAAMSLDQLPTAEQIVNWRGGKAGTYLYRTNVFTRERDDLGNFHFEQKSWDIQSSSLLTPQEVNDQVTDQFNANTDDYPAELLGVTLRGVYLQGGRSAA